MAGSQDPPALASDSSGRPLAPLSFAVFQLARAHRGYAAQLLRPLGLHPGQELVLLRLHAQDGQSQAALLDAVGLDHSTLSRSLTRMEAAGLVRRSPSTVDRRAVVVSLTDKGEWLRQPLRELWQELERTTTSAVAPGALEDLVGSLHAVRRAVVERAGQAVESDVHARQAAADSDG